MERGANGKYACPCCNYYTLEEPPNTQPTFEICDVCFWQEDWVMQDSPDVGGGANIVSLNQARINFKAFGAAEDRGIPHVRPPKPDELR
ncbi:MAG: CPCC family cysteine-rich protein [Bacteroidota bacterium]